MTEHPSLVKKSIKPAIPQIVEAPENLESLRQKISELQKIQSERRQTISEITLTIDQINQTEQELNALEKEALELLIAKLKRLG
jgi:prefoldin subunit 5